MEQISELVATLASMAAESLATAFKSTFAVVAISVVLVSLSVLGFSFSKDRAP
jgi:hypothetical protein